MLHTQGGPEALAGGEDGGWALPLGAALLGVRQVGLGGWQTAECAAIENELAAWQRLGEFGARDSALRCGIRMFESMRDDFGTRLERHLCMH